MGGGVATTSDPILVLKVMQKYRRYPPGRSAIQFVSSKHEDFSGSPTRP